MVSLSQAVVEVVGLVHLRISEEMVAREVLAVLLEDSLLSVLQERQVLETAFTHFKRRQHLGLALVVTECLAPQWLVPLVESFWSFTNEPNTHH